MMAEIASIPGVIPNIRGAFGGTKQTPEYADQSTLLPLGGTGGYPSERVVYVSPGGSDSANGMTPATSVKTLAKAGQILDPTRAGRLGALIMDEGTIDAGAGWSLSGYAFAIFGKGDASAVTATKAQTGPVMDFSGYICNETIWSKRPIWNFQVIGDGIADPTNTHKGIKLPSDNSIAVMDFHNISISNTGGTGFDSGDAEICDFKLTINQPVSPFANSIPYFSTHGAWNGNNLNLTVRGLATTIATAATGGAVQILDDGSAHAPGGNRIYVQSEYLWIPTNGCIIIVQGDSNDIELVDFDSQVASFGVTTGSRYIKLIQPSWASTGTLGGNYVHGYINGADSSEVGYLNGGVEITQDNNRVEGIKGFYQDNVILDPGVNYTYCCLGGQESFAAGPSYIDNSGTSTNLLLDAANSASPGALTAFSGTITSPLPYSLTSNSKLFMIPNSGGQAALVFQELGGSVDDWWIYEPQGSGDLFVRDMINAHTLLSFYPGATDVAAAIIVDARLTMDGVFFPQQAATASAPTYVKGGMYFDTTLNKLRIGGASGWETVTSV